MKLSYGLAGLAATLAAVPTALAWGGAGHEIVATIAQIYLHPSALSNVCDILYPGSAALGHWPPCYISRVASWADQIKRSPQYRYTAAMHYVGAVGDHPCETCLFPGADGWAGKRDINVLGAVRNMTDVLVGYTDGSFDRDIAEDAVKFLIHYMGDMHMPLHLTGRERGGNGARVAFDGRATNLHSLWDSLLIAKSLRTISSNYTRRFPHDSTSVDVEAHLRDTIYDPYVRRVMWEGMGVGSVPGRFAVETIEEWLTCPEPAPEGRWDQGVLGAVQTTLGLRAARDEERWDDEVLCPFAWSKTLHGLNCELVWPAALDRPPYNQSAFGARGDEHDHESPDDFFARPRRPHPDLLELDTPEYAGKIYQEWVIERLMATAGIRLAGLLNGLFMDVESLGNECDLPVVYV
ncbi:S1/P1 nucleases [Phanerochaete sordida]|uniref:S1/P1 nucleases n=1 Tax=Phanerochaete sordida TaxID=48140 RepID=A0A9P3L8Z5_9APHY|nr:S1/P1 nucleases [Phanerochaete sordida]